MQRERESERGISESRLKSHRESPHKRDTRIKLEIERENGRRERGKGKSGNQKGKF